MSPFSAPVGSMSFSFPRVSGDEPARVLPALTLKRFSPRERG